MSPAATATGRRQIADLAQMQRRRLLDGLELHVVLSFSQFDLTFSLVSSIRSLLALCFLSFTYNTGLGAFFPCDEDVWQDYLTAILHSFRVHPLSGRRSATIQA